MHRGERLDRADRTTLDGIPITTATRVLIDVAGLLPHEDLELALESAIRQGLTRPRLLAARLRSLGGKGRSGSGALQAILDVRGEDPALESKLEARFSRLLLKAGFPRPERQHWVSLGARRYRLDFAWPDRRVAVECDGFSAHGGRLSFIADRRRLADLASHGWTVIPVTWEECTWNPGAVVESVRRAPRGVA